MSLACSGLETNVIAIAPTDLLTVDSEQHDGKMLFHHAQPRRTTTALTTRHSTKKVPFAQYLCDTSNVVDVDMTRVRPAGLSCHLRRSCATPQHQLVTRRTACTTHFARVETSGLISSELQSFFVPIGSSTNDSKHAAVCRK